MSPGGIEYDHDPFGRRIRKQVNGAETFYLWDGDRLLAEYDGSGSRTARYAYAGGFAPLEATFASGTYEVHTDHLDTPRMLTNAAGAAVWRAAYQAFGSAAVDEDPDGDSNNVTFNFRFPGQYFDQETGLHDNRFRTYDPAVGRYISADPIGQFGLRRSDGGVFVYLGVFPELVGTDALRGGDSNPYGYALHRPLSLIDPLGLYSCSYSISRHSMSCRANDPSNPGFSTDAAVSGQNTPDCPDCQNSPDRTDVPFAGSIPTGDFSIGPQRENSSRRPLTPRPGTDLGNRDSFQTHGCGNPGTCSEGCIAFTANAARDAFNNAMSREEGNNTLTVVP